VENRFGVIGTPDDAIALIERLYAKQGAFGVMLHQAHNWADWEATKRSYELYARYVMPRFSGDNAPRIESFDWCTEHRDELTEKRSAAARAMFDKHEAEQLAAQAQAQTPGPTQAQTLGQTPMRTSAQMGAMARPKTGREAW
jgi:limonene 1,2-monooxygenase